MLSLAAFAAGLGWMAPVQAGNVVCKASVQDAHGIASGWIGNDGRQAVPLKGLFVFPPGTVAREAGASDYQLGKPAHLPPDTLFVSAQFALAMDGNDLHVGLDTLEIDGPSIARTDGGAVDPLFVLAPGADAVLRENAAVEGEAMALRLHTEPGHADRGDLSIPDEDKAAVSKLFAGGEVAIAGGDLHHPGAVYRTVVRMTDAATVQSMLVAALKQAAANAPAGAGCEPAGD